MSNSPGPDIAVQLMEEAWADRREDRLDEAREKLSEAVSRSRKPEMRPQLAAALGKLAQVERERGDSSKAQSLFKQAVAVAREEGEPLVLAYTLRHLGDFHRRAGRLDEAEPCLREALELHRLAGGDSELVLANAVRSLAVLLEDRGLSQESAGLWREARDLYESAGIQEGVDECVSRLARLKS